jgi:hypothetical protein
LNTTSIARAFVVALSAAAAGCSAGNPDRNAVAESRMVGAWRSSIQFKDGAFSTVKDLEFLYVFNHGGTLTESSNYDGAPPVPPAYGVWKESGVGHIEATYTYFNTRPPTDVQELLRSGWMPGGRGVVTERISLAADAKSFDSTITFVLYGQSGERIEGAGSGTGHGVRINLQ